MKVKDCKFDNFVATDGTVSCRNFRCHHWRQSVKDIRKSTFCCTTHLVFMVCGRSDWLLIVHGIPRWWAILIIIKKLSILLSHLKIAKLFPTSLKATYRRFDNSVVCCHLWHRKLLVSGHCDNLQRHHWRQRCQINDLLFSLMEKVIQMEVPRFNLAVFFPNTLV